MMKLNIKRKVFTVIVVLLASYLVSAQKYEGSGYREINDILYLDKREVQNDSLQRLNLVLPDGGENTPLLIWIGGGAWSYGDRNQEMHLARKLAQSGIAVASIGHRMSPAIWRDSILNKGIQHPEHIKDVASAVKWLFQHAKNYKYSTDKFFIGGYSSGAHLAALLHLNKKYLKEADVPINLFKGIIPVSGTYDINDYHKILSNGGRPELAQLHVEAVFGKDVDAFKEASPVNYLNNLSVPVLLISDTNMYGYTRLFEDKIRSTDFRKLETIYIHHLSHGQLWKNLSFEEYSIYREMILNFIKSNTSGAKE